MNNFSLARASTPAEASQLGSLANTRFIAGGTELLNWMRLGIAEPERVVEISRVDGLTGIREEQGAIWFGSLETLATVQASALVQRAMPVLAEACMRAASPQIRNRATLGGNVLQKTRCAYFRTEAPLPWGCNKREPGSGCAARQDGNERHAIFGWTDDCVATQPSDPVVALACLDAIAEVQGAQGRRTIPVRQLLLTQQEAATLGPQHSSATMESRLAPGELIVGFRVPTAHARRSAYVKVRERASYEYAMVSAAATLDIQGSTIQGIRLALGSVAQKPWRLEKAERELQGKPMSLETVAAAVAVAMSDAKPLAHNAFKVKLATNAAVRAVEEAWRMA